MIKSEGQVELILFPPRQALAAFQLGEKGQLVLGGAQDCLEDAPFPLSSSGGAASAPSLLPPRASGVTSSGLHARVTVATHGVGEAGLQDVVLIELTCSVKWQSHTWIELI